MKNTIILAAMLVIGMSLTGCKDNPFGSERSVRDNAKGITLKCVNGYVFAIYDNYYQGGITQVWEMGEDGLPRPQLCPPSTDTKKFIWE